MSGRTLAAMVLVAGVALGGCGGGEPDVRLKTEVGRVLTYDLEQRDEWPGAEEAVLQANARVRLTCTEYAREGGARYQAEVLSLRVSSPEKIGLDFDTSTPETEPGDALGVESLVLPLLGVKTTLVLSPTGRPENIQGEPKLVDPIREWVNENPQQRASLGGILVKLVDGAIVTATSLDLLAHCLPRDAGASAGTKWTVAMPKGPEGRAGPIENLDVELARPAPDRAVVSAGAKMNTSESASGVVGDTPAGGIADGRMTLTGEIDTARGVILRVSLENEMTLTDPSGSGRTMSTQQKRTFTLVEE